MAYERQYYTNGDVLDARQLNHMETGIKENLLRHVPNQ